MNLINTFAGSGNYEKSIASAMLALGGTHAPITETIEFMNQNNPEELVAIGVRIPGFGNSFEKGHPDPVWEPVGEILKESFTVLHDKLMRIQSALHLTGKIIFPNASAFTACAVIATGFPSKLSHYFVVKGRLDAWTAILLSLKGAT